MMGIAFLPACSAEAPLQEYSTTETVVEAETDEIPGLEEKEDGETSSGGFTISFDRLKVVLDWF